MDNAVFEINPEMTIYIEQVGGDLRVVGWEQPQFSAESEDEDSLHLQNKDNTLHFRADSDCTIRLPRQARLRVDRVGGDATFKSMDNSLSVDQVGGDLVLRQVGAVNLGRVGGDLSAKKLSGALNAGQVSGDLSAVGVNGDFNASKISGDVYLRDVEGGIQVSAGGDAILAVAFAPGGAYAAQAGGDLTCRLEPSASARFTISAGGGVSVDVMGASIEGSGGKRTVTLGGGEANVALRAGGSVTLAGLNVDPEAMGEFGERFGDDFGLMAEEFATQIESQIQAQMADFEKNFTERMSGLDFGASHLNEEIASKARRAAEKVERAARQKAEAAKRRVEAAQRRAEAHADRAQRLAEAARERAQRHGPGSFTFGFGPRPPTPPRPPVPPRPFSPPTPPSEAVSEEERMVILRMLEQGKISVADAEKLLAALENK